ncbi:hypothetical protein HII31_03677 [Pseudocercospora fuligena]|uniref:Uncharacterized protein n=1 Tax=Pseudocercospora fuligena TaxID=685502 RepID=A0A8H6RPN6_9PEZI|nr:hypothetical protein HII31_03677 [Pseudocercospora fuligena]
MSGQPNQVPKSGSQDFGHKEPGKMFAGLEQYKRNDGPASEARRESLKDMSAKPAGGMISNLFNSTFKGDNNKS